MKQLGMASIVDTRCQFKKKLTWWSLIWLWTETLLLNGAMSRLSSPRQRVPAHTSFICMVNNFATSRSVTTMWRPKKYVLCREFEEAILGYFSAKPKASTREAAKTCGGNITTVWRVLVKDRLYPFHVSLHQGLTDTDFLKCLDFCNWELIQMDRDRNFIKKSLAQTKPSFVEIQLWTFTVDIIGQRCIHNGSVRATTKYGGLLTCGAGFTITKLSGRLSLVAHSLGHYTASGYWKKS